MMAPFAVEPFARPTTAPVAAPDAAPMRAPASFLLSDAHPVDAATAMRVGIRTKVRFMVELLSRVTRLFRRLARVHRGKGRVPCWRSQQHRFKPFQGVRVVEF